MNKIILITLLFLTCLKCSAELIQDDFAKQTLVNVAPPVINTKYNYQDTVSVPIKLAVTQNIYSEKNLYEGQTINFKLIRHVVYKNKIIAERGTVVPAKVKMIITIQTY